MKSHLIPEPQPSEYETTAESGSATGRRSMDSIYAALLPSSQFNQVHKAEELPAPDAPIRNFLRVVFVC